MSQNVPERLRRRARPFQGGAGKSHQDFPFDALKGLPAVLVRTNRLRLPWTFAGVPPPRSGVRCRFSAVLLRRVKIFCPGGFALLSLLTLLI